MFFMSRDEAARWAQAQGLVAESLAGDVVDSNAKGSIRVDYGEQVSSYALACRLAQAMGNVPEVCLWVTEYGIWPSVENLHLYYKLRECYGDHRNLSEAPAHKFLSFERADLTSFLQLFLEFRWGGRIISSPCWTTVHVSHDGWFAVETEERRAEITALFEDMGPIVSVHAR